MPITIKDDQKLCVKCETPRSRKRAFYQSTSRWHSNGLVPYCKDCLKETLDENNINSVKNVLRQIDKPYIEDLWTRAVEHEKETLGTYLSSLKVGSNKDKTYDDSEFINLGFKDSEQLEDETQQPTDFKVTNEMKRVWGNNLSDTDIEYLENFYFEYKNNYSTDTPVQRNLYRNIAKIHLQAEKELDGGQVKTFKELMELSSKLHNDGNIKPIQSTGANDDKGLSAYGLWIKEVELNEPCEYFEKKPVYEDVDGFKKYIDKWFVRPFKNIFNLSKDFDVED